MIELKHIEFAYESGSELLRNINMQVNDGEYIAIVGADELNFCVRDGNRWTLIAINTNYFGWVLSHHLC